MKQVLCGEPGAEPNSAACAALGQEAIQCNFFMSVLENFAKLPSDVKI